MAGFVNIQGTKYIEIVGEGPKDKDYAPSGTPEYRSG